MKRIDTPLANAFVVEPRVHQDHRGFFMESFREDTFHSLGVDLKFIQDNHARSEAKHVLRGLHFQTAPHAQAKLIRVLSGAIYDVIVDLRKGSKTYGQSFGVELTSDNFKMLFVPHGFAHGYCTLVPETEVFYKVDAYYAPQNEGGILWNDPDLKIDWPTQDPILSEKDKTLSVLSKFDSPF